METFGFNPLSSSGRLQGRAEPTSTPASPGFNPLSSSGRLQGRPHRAGKRLSLGFQSPFFIGASSGGVHSWLISCLSIGFQSPFFIGASSGEFVYQHTGVSSGSFNPLSSSGRLQGSLFFIIDKKARHVSIPFLHRGVFRGSRLGR